MVLEFPRLHNPLKLRHILWNQLSFSFVQVTEFVDFDIETKMMLSFSIIIAYIAPLTLAVSPWTRTRGQKFYGSSFAIPGSATYDYVIVGGGLAGLTVANRLSEDPSNRVAVVEAGSFYEISNGNYSQIPFYATKFSTGNISDTQPSVDWEIVTEPETVCIKYLIISQLLMVVIQAS